MGLDPSPDATRFYGPLWKLVEACWRSFRLTTLRAREPRPIKEGAYRRSQHSAARRAGLREIACVTIGGKCSCRSPSTAAGEACGAGPTAPDVTFNLDPEDGLHGRRQVLRPATLQVSWACKTPMSNGSSGWPTGRDWRSHHLPGQTRLHFGFWVTDSDSSKHGYNNSPHAPHGASACSLLRP
jgi:hypothetical protein